MSRSLRYSCFLCFADDLRPQSIFIAGDSTAASYQNKDHQGWGATLQSFLNEDEVVVDNRARGGRSSLYYRVVVAVPD